MSLAKGLDDIKEKVAALLENNNDQSCKPSLNTSQILVLLGILGGVFEVTSVLVDSDQEVQVVLSGSLKRKTDLDKTLDDIGSHTFDEVMEAIIGRFG